MHLNILFLLSSAPPQTHVLYKENFKTHWILSVPSPQWLSLNKQYFIKYVLEIFYFPNLLCDRKAGNVFIIFFTSPLHSSHFLVS